MFVSTMLQFVRAEISRRTVNAVNAARAFLVILAAMAVSAPALANAEAPTSEWRLLGPAWSVHDSLAGAPWSGPRVPEFCDIGGGAGGRQCTPGERAVSIAPGLPKSNCATLSAGGGPDRQSPGGCGSPTWSPRRPRARDDPTRNERKLVDN